MQKLPTMAELNRSKADQRRTLSGAGGAAKGNRKGFMTVAKDTPRSGEQGQPKPMYKEGKTRESDMLRRTKAAYKARI